MLFIECPSVWIGENSASEWVVIEGHQAIMLSDFFLEKWFINDKHTRIWHMMDSAQKPGNSFTEFGWLTNGFAPLHLHLIMLNGFDRLTLCNWTVSFTVFTLLLLHFLYFGFAERSQWEHKQDHSSNAKQVVHETKRNEMKWSKHLTSQ